MPTIISLWGGLNCKVSINQMHKKIINGKGKHIRGFKCQTDDNVLRMHCEEGRVSPCYFIQLEIYLVSLKFSLAAFYSILLKKMISVEKYTRCPSPSCTSVISLGNSKEYMDQ